MLRHGHAGQKREWPLPDRERPLRGRGRQEALGVVGTLQHVPVHRLLSSPYRRCWETLIPLSAARGIPVEHSGLLAPDAPLDQVLALLSGPDADGAVFCTHGELLERVLDSWQSDGPVEVRRRVTTKKGALWVVGASASRAPVARYHSARRVKRSPR
nr:histidine phosphatase family protein [Motilibacter aurantiacus]